MIALQKGADGNNLSSPEVNMVSSKSTGDLNLWSGNEAMKCENDSELESYEIEFQTVMGDYSAYSPPLWASTSHINENLLPHNHHYSSPPPKSQLQVIQGGRKELMNMVQGLPESFYEHSLQDIVDNQKITQQVQDKEKKVEGRNIQNAVKRQISRSRSMNNEDFLLKMFLPSCLSCKKKTTFGNHTKVSRTPSFDGCEEQIDKERWSIRYLASRKNRSNSSGSSSSGSTGFNSSRYDFITNFQLVCFIIHQAGTSMATLHQVAGYPETYANQENTEDVYSKQMYVDIQSLLHQRGFYTD